MDRERENVEGKKMYRDNNNTRVHEETMREKNQGGRWIWMWLREEEKVQKRRNRDRKIERKIIEKLSDRRKELQERVKWEGDGEEWIWIRNRWKGKLKKKGRGREE